jgi:hypothetical protein
MNFNNNNINKAFELFYFVFCLMFNILNGIKYYHTVSNFISGGTYVLVIFCLIENKIIIQYKKMKSETELELKYKFTTNINNKNDNSEG